MRRVLTTTSAFTAVHPRVHFGLGEATSIAVLKQIGVLAGHGGVIDADRLRIDPAMRRAVGNMAMQKRGGAHEQTESIRDSYAEFEGDPMSQMDLSGMWIDWVKECVPLDKRILDVDCLPVWIMDDSWETSVVAFRYCTS